MAARDRRGRVTVPGSWRTRCSARASARNALPTSELVASSASSTGENQPASALSATVAARARTRARATDTSTSRKVIAWRARPAPRRLARNRRRSVAPLARARLLRQLRRRPRARASSPAGTPRPPPPREQEPSLCRLAHEQEPALALPSPRARPEPVVLHTRAASATSRRERAIDTAGSPRQTDRRAELHQRLIEVAGRDAHRAAPSPPPRSHAVAPRASRRIDLDARAAARSRARRCRRPPRPARRTRCSRPPPPCSAPMPGSSSSSASVRGSSPTLDDRARGRVQSVARASSSPARPQREHLIDAGARASAASGNAARNRW